jgi:uncharacterized protein
MRGLATWLAIAWFVLPAAVARAATPAAPAPAASASQPLVIGETFTLDSHALHEVRRINVYRPPWVADTTALPVMVMPDGGVAEDFVHVAGLLEVGSGNGTMRPFLLVGIENTERRRDMTGPTHVHADSAIAPHVGGAAAFRAFVRDELLPEVRRRHRVTRETAIVGESLAGLFSLETFLREPDLFDACVALDPSLWWNEASLLREAAALARRGAGRPRAIFIASSAYPQMAADAKALADTLRAAAVPGLRVEYQPFPDETHATIYHPAALRAFRLLFAPPAAPAR